VLTEVRILEVQPEECIEAFHTVKVPAGLPGLALSFRSHYEEGLSPRYEEGQQTAIHMAISFWRSQETCRILAKRYPKHGAYIARRHADLRPRVWLP